MPGTIGEVNKIKAYRLKINMRVIYILYCIIKYICVRAITIEMSHCHETALIYLV